MAGLYDINYMSPGAANPTGAYFQNNMTAPATSGVISGQSMAGVQAPALTQASTPLGMNLGTGQLLLGGIGTLGNLWAAFQAQKLAREQFDFQKGITNTNLANQIQSYNTTLTDRINARSFMQDDDQATTDAYIRDNALKDERKK